MPYNEKYAILLLTHKNVNQVNRLINKISHPNVDIFIHCDKRWDIDYNDIKKPKGQNIYFSDERVCSDLDTWDLVKATMLMIQKSKNVNPDGYKYYILLSGQDYPVQSMENIIQNLEEEYPKPFIDCTPWDKNNWIYSKFTNVYYYQKYSRFVNKFIARGFIRKCIKIIPYIVNKYIIAKLFDLRKKLSSLSVELYGGSAWWILPDVIIDYILSEYEKNDNYMKVLSRTLTPEETFFQIMSMRSELSALIDVNECDRITQNCKTYAWFFDEVRSFVGHPYIFTIAEKDKLKKLSETHFFARKFDENIDSEVFDWIDENLL